MEKGLPLIGGEVSGKAIFFSFYIPQNRGGRRIPTEIADLVENLTVIFSKDEEKHNKIRSWTEEAENWEVESAPEKGTEEEQSEWAVGRVYLCSA